MDSNHTSTHPEPDDGRNPGIPPRGQLFADPAAGAVWAAILSLDPALQHDILQELQLRLAVTASSPGDLRIERAIAALREAAEILGRSPSVEDYRRLRAENPEFTWPPDGSLRSWLGRVSWNDCLRAARLNTVVDGDVVTSSLGGPITPQEIADALRQCAAELDCIPSYSVYIGWARRPDVKARPGRRPLSQSPFDRQGGFPASLKLAGLIDDTTVVRAPRSSRVRAGSYFISEQACFDGIREVAERLGRPPRVAEYIRERDAIIAETEAAGTPRTIPSYNAIQKRWRVWDDALTTADLEPLGGRATGKVGARKERKAPRISEELMLEAIREAYEALGNPFTKTAYERWRLEQLERDQSARVFRTIPSYFPIWKHFGSWQNAVRKALEDAGPTDEDDEPPAGVLVPA